jgi:hypothetical protein
MTKKQTEAQRLADELLHMDHERWSVLDRAAAELRRLHSVNAQLLEALVKCEASLVLIDEAMPFPVAKLAISKARAAIAVAKEHT